MTKAQNLAEKMHMQPSSEQRYGGEPYTKHLKDVRANIEKYIHLIPSDQRINVIDAGDLHDIVEDTEMTPRKLANEFNVTVAQIVTNVSNVRELDKIKETLITLSNIRGCILSTYVKICDRMANGLNSKINEDPKANRMFDKYQKSYPTFRYALKDGNIFEEMWKDLDAIFEYIEPAVATSEILRLQQSLIEMLFHHENDTALPLVEKFLESEVGYKKYVMKRHHLPKGSNVAKFIIEYVL